MKSHIFQPIEEGDEHGKSKQLNLNLGENIRIKSVIVLTPPLAL